MSKLSGYGSDVSLSSSYSELPRPQLESNYEQVLASIAQMKREIDVLEQKLTIYNTRDLGHLVNERKELLCQLQRSSHIEKDIQKKVRRHEMKWGFFEECNFHYFSLNFCMYML